MSDFLHMGGYAFYVWSAYGITLMVLIGNIIVPRQAERAALAELELRLQRAKTGDT